MYGMHQSARVYTRVNSRQKQVYTERRDWTLALTALAPVLRQTKISEFIPPSVSQLITLEANIGCMLIRTLPERRRMLRCNAANTHKLSEQFEDTVLRSGGKPRAGIEFVFQSGAQ
jgi:hypothetical protein